MGKRRMVGPSAWWLLGAGAFIGVVSALLVKFGNPGNMGVCIACFLRDITGYFVGGFTNQGGVSYIRPEIVGIGLGAFGSALVFKEFRPRGGSSPAIRFILGFIFVVSALVFLGCTVRAWLRLGGGDLNALWGVLGIIVGVLVGVLFLKSGFSLGRAKVFSSSSAKIFGWILPALMVILLVLSGLSALGIVPAWATQTPANQFATAGPPAVVFTKAEDGSIEKVKKPEGATLQGDGSVVDAEGAQIATSEQMQNAKKQPGALRAPFLISLVAGLLIGIVAQRSRFCSIGGIRDAVLVRSFDLLFGVVGMLVGATIMNLLLGQYNLGFEGQPVAHVGFIGNFAPMVLAGLSAALLGGCPFRQLIMGNEGDADATAAVAGILVGAGVASFFSVTGSSLGVPTNAWYMLGACAVVLLLIGFLYSFKAKA